MRTCWFKNIVYARFCGKAASFYAASEWVICLFTSLDNYNHKHQNIQHYITCSYLAVDKEIDGIVAKVNVSQ